MPTIFAATESSVLIDGEALEGITAIEYNRSQVRTNVYAVGSAERIGVISGRKTVQGRLRLASTSQKLDGMPDEARFQISAQFRHGETRMTVSFDDCLLEQKTLELGVGGYAEAVYSFSATRVREELG
jgi:hypothetical protein